MSQIIPSSAFETARVETIDRSALLTNQTAIVAVILIAFAGSFFWWPAVVLIPILSIVLLLSTASPRLALFKQLYHRVLRPAGLVAPRPSQESAAPHNFAQLLGGVFLAVSTFLLPVAPAAGLAVALLVMALAALNLATGYCVGCQIYGLLARARAAR